MARQGKMHSSPFHVESRQYKYAIEHEVDTRLLKEEILPTCSFLDKTTLRCSKWNSGYSKCQGHHCAVVEKKFGRNATCDSCGFFFDSVCYRQLKPLNKESTSQDAGFCCYYLSVEQNEKQFRYVRNSCYQYSLSMDIRALKSQVEMKKRSITNLQERIARENIDTAEIESISEKIPTGNI